MVAQSRAIRALFDEAGFDHLQIFASSNFDEYKIADLLAAGAAIDAFGVGTRVGVSADRPYLDLVYKLVSLAGRPIRKLSSGKVTLAGAKQVYRRSDEAGRFRGDWLAWREEPPLDDAAPLLEPVMRNGRRCAPTPEIDAIRAYLADQTAAMPTALKSIRAPDRYPVRTTSQLEALQAVATP
jgi:nicotinate phosphoribosyltransferase